jgi:hypothetical protein
MYDLERTKKTIIAMFCLSALSLVLTFIGFARGGGELLRYGFMNNPAPAILMFVFAGIFIISLLTGIGFRALCKDIAEQLKYLDSGK